MDRIKGSCLCGSVRISLTPKEKTFDACHCGMCRRWGGGPGLTIQGGENIAFEGKESIQIYNSSDWAERGFCKNCGSHLFYHLKNTDFYSFFLGLFEGVEDFKFQVQIYIDSKPSHYDFSNKTETMTEAEVIAKFNSTSS